MSRKGIWPLMLIVSLFFLWGMANNLNDILIAHFRSALVLGDFQSGIVQSAFYLGYFCFAIPAALFMRAYGYKGGVLIGLGLFGAGALLFWPAASMVSYPAFLFALFVIASGLAFLETAANPLVAAMGPADGAARRLNLAQAFNPLGSIAGIEIGRRFILASGTDAGPSTAASRAAELSSVQLPYLAIGCFVLIWALLIAVTRFPESVTRVSAEELAVPSRAQYRSLIATPRFRLGVVAQFAYVGAQVGIWSYLIRYVEQALPGTSATTAAGYVTASLVLFAIGRFAGSALLGRVRAPLLLLGFAGINSGLCLLAVLLPGSAGIAALVGASFFMSIMYPTIFVLAIDGLGGLAKAGSSLIVMAIVGGAAITALMGLVSDAMGGISMAMAVPALCFAIVALFAWAHRAAPAGRQ